MKKRNLLLATLHILLASAVWASQPPRLVIGIVVDQMRYDYLEKFAHLYGSNGFKRLTQSGFQFKNAQYTYVPTYTGPGHASIYTGTTPALHGIVGNSWFDAKRNAIQYVTSDGAYNGLGTTGSAGQMAPTQLIATTITDELKLKYGKAAKVFGVSLKDRGAILPAGHQADFAFWFDGRSGNWISSSFYGTALPDYVQKLNASGAANNYVSKNWELLFPAANYRISIPDNNAYEHPFPNQKTTAFPHPIPTLFKNASLDKKYDIVRKIPFGNQFTTDLALEILNNEHMGQDSIPDFLTISYSATDYIGHQFGPQSFEVADTYARLDQEIARLMLWIDQHMGAQQVLIFLTADHGAAEVPRYMNDLKSPGGYLDDVLLHQNVIQFGMSQWGIPNILRDSSNMQLYLNVEEINRKQLDLNEVASKIAEYMRQFPGIGYVLTRNQLLMSNAAHQLFQKLLMGYYPKRSGDIVWTMESGYLEKSYTFSGGTSHGGAQQYDTHVPLVWYGGNIAAGVSHAPVSVCDIAPTLSVILGTNFPSENIGKPLF